MSQTQPSFVDSGIGDSSDGTDLTQPQLRDEPETLRYIRENAYVKIIEQPGQYIGMAWSARSTPENITYPTIEIVGFKGRATVVVSCVTKDEPYRPHPCNLIGREGCRNGVCIQDSNQETMQAVFKCLRTQHGNRRGIENSLHMREVMRVDPFKTGFSHRLDPDRIDIHSLRMCFQVFLHTELTPQPIALTPIVSDPIGRFNRRSIIAIRRLCSCSSTVIGGQEIILLCETVAKDDISVRLFEEHNGQLVWEDFGNFQHSDVHKRTAIAFKTPPYRTIDIEQPVSVFVQLRRPSDGATSEPVPFKYLPIAADVSEFHI